MEETFRLCLVVMVKLTQADYSLVNEITIQFWDQLYCLCTQHTLPKSVTHLIEQASFQILRHVIRKVCLQSGREEYQSA